MTRTLSPLRTDRITASRLPALLGISPYTTPAALMREMVREHFGDEQEFTGNFVTDWGHEHEADIVAEYELTQGVRVRNSGPDQQTLVHPGYDFLAATPDGIAGGRVLECKAPWRGLYTSIAERPDYEAQMRLQMEVTGHFIADLAIWRPGQPLLVDTIKRDAMWLDTVLPAIGRFLGEYAEVIADPVKAAPHREPLRDQRDDPQWAGHAIQWLELDYLVKQLAAKRDAAATSLSALSPDKPARGAGVDLLRYERKGAVQYKQLLTDQNITVDLEKYRGKTAQVETVRRVGAK